MAKQSHNLPYVTLAGVIILAITITGVLIRPAVMAASKNSEDLAKAKLTLNEKRQYLNSIDLKLSDLKANADYERQLDVILPANESFEDVLRLTNRIGVETGVVIRSLLNNSASLKKQYESAKARGVESSTLPLKVVPMGMELDITGDYQQIRAFIDRLEKLPRLTNITNMRLRHNDVFPGQINGRFTVRLYRFGK